MDIRHIKDIILRCYAYNILTDHYRHKKSNKKDSFIKSKFVANWRKAHHLKPVRTDSMVIIIELLRFPRLYRTVIHRYSSANMLELVRTDKRK